MKTTKKPLVSIIVLNYNGLGFLKQCLPTIKKQSYANIETIVVDNNSTDGSQKYVKQQKWVVLVENVDNYGYSKANNIAASHARGKFLFFLNNDTELFPNAIENLVRCYQPNSIVAAAQIIAINKNTDKIGASGSGMDIFGYSYANVVSKKDKALFCRRSSHIY